MVAHLLRLRLLLLGNSLRRSPLGIAGLALAVVYGAALTALAVLGMMTLSQLDPHSARALSVVAGSILIAVVFLIPMFFGGHDQFDPRRFSLLGAEPDTLATALIVAALVSLSGVGAIVIVVAHAAVFSHQVLSVVLAVATSPVLLLLLVVTARLGLLAGAWMHERPIARATLRALAVIGAVLMVPILLRLTAIDWPIEGIAALEVVAGVLAWTPLGAGWAVAPTAAVGELPAAIAMLVLAIATVVALCFVWRTVVRRVLVSDARPPRSRPAVVSGLRLRGAAGAIAARSLMNWLRDPRYLTSTVIVPIVPLLMALPLLIAGVSPEIVALIPVPVVALFLGWSTHNDVAYDHSAIWMHVAAHTRGVDDRLGRTIPALLMGAPVVVVTALVCAGIHGDPTTLAPMLGVGLGMLGVGLGVSAVFSARFPYPAVLPGDSPFTQPSSGNGALVQSFVFLVILLLSSPLLALGAASLLLGEAYPWITLAAGLLWGFLVLAAGIRIGGRVFDRRGPELLAAALRS